MPNIDNINRLINHLKSLKNDESFNMGNWVRFDWFENESDIEDWENEPAAKLVERMNTFGDCGTVACLAGHAALLKAADDGDVSDAHYFSSKSVAKAWLGITKDQADLLFEPRQTNSELIMFSRKDAIKTLERLRDTGEVFWPETVSYCGSGYRVSVVNH